MHQKDLLLIEEKKIYCTRETKTNIRKTKLFRFRRNISNDGETVLTPFMGVGSEVYSPVSLGRKAIGIELKDSYFKQAIINLSLAHKRFSEDHKQEVLI